MDTTKKIRLATLKQIVTTATKGLGAFLLVFGLAMPVWGQDATCEDADLSKGTLVGGTLLLGCADTEVARDNGYIDAIETAKTTADADKTAADKVAADAGTAVDEARAAPDGADQEATVAHTASVGLADAVKTADGNAGTAVALAAEQMKLATAETAAATKQMELAAAETAAANAATAVETAEAVVETAEATKEAADAAKTRADADLVIVTQAAKDAQADLDDPNRDPTMVLELNSALTRANADVVTADGQVTRAGMAVTDAGTEVTTAEGEVTTAEGAVTTAEDDVTMAEGAVTTAEGDVTTAEAAVTTATTADTMARATAAGDPVAAKIVAAEDTAALATAAATAAGTEASGAGTAVATGEGAITAEETAERTSRQNAARDEAVAEALDAAIVASNAGAPAGEIPAGAETRRDAVTALYAAAVQNDPDTMEDEAMAAGADYATITTEYTIGPKGVEIAAEVAARATSENSIAIGQGATLGASVDQTGTNEDGTPILVPRAADNAVAIGAGSHVERSDSVAVGAGATTTGEGSIALGMGTTAEGDNSIAIGAGAMAGENAIVIGSDAHTSVTVGGMDLTGIDQAVGTNTAGIETNVEGIATNAGGIATNAGGISANTSGISANRSDIFRNSSDIDSNRSGVAMAIAFAHLPSVATGDRGSWGIGAGQFDGESAIALGMSLRVQERGQIKFGVSSSGGETSVGIGFGMGF